MQDWQPTSTTSYFIYTMSNLEQINDKKIIISDKLRF